MLHIAICDDEVSVFHFLSKSIEELLEKAGYECDFYFFDSGEQLLAHFSLNPDTIDIVFLDINLVTLNGIDVALQISDFSQNTILVFISAEKDFITDSFAAEPLSYLLKPIKKDKLELTIDRCLRSVEDMRSQESASFAIIKSGKQIKKIELKKIECIESQKRLCLFYFSEGIEKTYAKLDEIVVELPDYFLRVHKSFVVNMNKIATFGQGEVSLTSGLVVPVPRNNMNFIRSEYLKYHQKTRILGR